MIDDSITIRVPAALFYNSAVTPPVLTRALEDFLQHFAMLGYAPRAWGDLCEDTGARPLHVVRVPARQQAMEVCNGFIWNHEVHA